jgi:hypothetical protein
MLDAWQKYVTFVDVHSTMVCLWTFVLFNFVSSRPCIYFVILQLCVWTKSRYIIDIIFYYKRLDTSNQ